MCDKCCIHCNVQRHPLTPPAKWCSDKKEAGTCRKVRCDAERAEERRVEIEAQRQSKALVYDEQVLICYGVYDYEEKEPVKNIRYKLLEYHSKEVLKEGITDEKGKTERLVTKERTRVTVMVIRFDGTSYVEERIGDIATNNRKDSLCVVSFRKGSIYFDMRYVNPEKDKARSFIHAANTIKRTARLEKGDIWRTFDIKTECDIVAAWKELAELQKKAEREIVRGHILTHATITGTSGLEFALVGCDRDGTLALKEIRELPQLKWDYSCSILYLYGCRTGLPDSSEDNTTIAEAFFDAQTSLREVQALRGYGYFSYNPKTYVKIHDNPNEKGNVYLLAFRRMRNVSWANAAVVKYGSEGFERGDDSVIPPYIRRRP